MNRKTYQRFVLMLAVIATLSLQSCATMFTGTRDRIRIESQPPGAKIQIDGLDYGRTPADITVQRSLNSKTVVLRLDGYENRAFDLEKEFNAVSILNVLNGVLGFAIDAATGALMKYSTKQYTIELEPKKASNE